MSASSLKEKYEAEFKEFLKSKLDKIKQEQAEIESLINDKTSTNNKLSETEIEVKQKQTGYNPIWTWKQKVEYLLTGKEATTTELVDMVLENEPNLATQRAKVVGTVSAILSAKSKTPSDLFGKYQNERGVTIYKLNKKQKAVDYLI